MGNVFSATDCTYVRTVPFLALTRKLTCLSKISFNRNLTHNSSLVQNHRLFWWKWYVINTLIVSDVMTYVGFETSLNHRLFWWKWYVNYTLIVTDLMTYLLYLQDYLHYTYSDCLNHNSCSKHLTLSWSTYLSQPIYSNNVSSYFLFEPQSDDNVYIVHNLMM